MKNFITIMLILSLTGCSDAYLDVTPTDRLTQESFWRTREHAEAGLNGIYQALTASGAYGNSNQVTFETASSNALNYNNRSGFNNIAQGIHDASNTAIINNRWGDSYAGIGRANFLIGNISKVSLGEDLKKRFVAEAKFLRALFYHNLVTVYGGVPLILDPPALSQGNLPRNSAEEVLSQVLKDLDEAAADLPLRYSGTDKGRATKGAALALKARVLLYAGKWAEAAAAARSVMDLKVYDLFPSYRGLFYLENEGNQEVIFDVQFKFPEASHGMDIVLDGYNNVAPLKDLIDRYYMTDGKPFTRSPLYDPLKPYANRDPRLIQTYMYAGSQFKGATVTENQYPQTGFGQKKYTVYKDTEKPVATLVDGQSEINVILLRYADVLLMYAEAQNEVNGPDESVYQVLNQVRQRAGMPGFPAGLSQEDMRAEIRNERRVELAGEGWHYFDMLRWKTAEQEMNGDIYNGKGVRIGTRRFDPNRDYLWPIPTEVLQTNPALVQNPGWGR